MRIRPGALALLACLAACRGKGADAPRSSCDDVLGEVDDFSCGRAGGCEALAETPDLAARWRLTFAERSPSSQELQCTQTWLAARGLAADVDGGTSLRVEASYAQIEGLCRASVIAACELEVVADPCAGLDELGCGTEPGCRPLLGRRVDPSAGCLEPPAFTGCVSTDVLCPAVVVLAGPGDGSCWQFTNGCLPGQPWARDPGCADPTGFKQCEPGGVQSRPPLPQPVTVPAKIPRRLAAKALTVDNLDPALLDSEMIGGMPNPDGSARVRRSRAGSLGLVLKAGSKPLQFSTIELFVRPVEIQTNTPRPVPGTCGGKNQTYDAWTPAGPVTQLQVGSVVANHAVWDLEAPAGTELEIYFSLVGDQFPGGFFTYIVKFTERSGPVHWVESPAIELEYRQCAAP